MVVAYGLELDAERHPVLVKETELEYVEEPLTEPSKVVRLCNDLFRLRLLAEESVVMVATSSKGSVLGIFRVSQGTVCAAMCRPREIFIRALLVGASNIFIIHNHPSGDCEPSNEDIKITQELAKLGKVMGITLQDFLIIGDDEFYSARKEGELE